MRHRINYVLLVVRAFWELMKYDVLNTLLGFRSIYRGVEGQRVRKNCPDPSVTARVCNAVSLAACLYFKRVLCLQRSAVATRLLRKLGIDGRLVIGYRPSPFFSHAWVEVANRVVNDSPGYKERMRVLCVL